MAEAWRLHKHLLYEKLPDDVQLHVFLIFTSAAMPEYQPVEQAIINGIGQLIQMAETQVKKTE